MNQEADFWTPDGWRRGPVSDDAERLLSCQGDMGEALEANGYHKLAEFGDTGNYITQVSLTLYKHTATKHLYVEVWGGDYGLCEFFVDPPFCVPFIVDKLPVLVHSYGLQDDRALAGEMKLLRKVIAAFVRHEHGTHVIDEDGEETLEERHAREERWRRREQRDAAAKKAKLAEGAAS